MIGACRPTPDPITRPNAVHALAVAVVAGVALLIVPAANGQHLFEPEIGLKFFDGRINDEIVPGLSLGGSYGRVVSTSAAITVHADLGVHGARRGGDYAGNPGGRSLDLALGVMTSPALREHNRSIAPYAGASAGYGSAGIGGGVSSWTLGLEGGVRLGETKAGGLSLGMRVVRHFWTTSSNSSGSVTPRPGIPASNEFVVAGRWLFRLPA